MKNLFDYISMYTCIYHIHNTNMRAYTYAAIAAVRTLTEQRNGHNLSVHDRYMGLVAQAKING